MATHKAHHQFAALMVACSVGTLFCGCSERSASSDAKSAAAKPDSQLLSQYQSARDALVSAASTCEEGSSSFSQAGDAAQRGEITLNELKGKVQQASDACDMSAASMRSLKSSIPITAPDKKREWEGVIDTCADAMEAGHAAFSKMASFTERGISKSADLLRAATAKQAQCNQSIDLYRDRLENLSNGSSGLPGPAPFKAAFIPPASGEGNFEICLKSSSKQDDLDKVTVPTNVVFQSWGQLVKDLRDDQNNDMRATGGDLRDPAIKELTSYAVITTRPVTLSQQRMCAMTTVRAATSEGFGWAHEVVPAGIHFLFAPQPNVVKGRTVFGQQWGTSTTSNPNGPSYGGAAGEAIQNEEFTGAVVKDVGNPVRLLDEP